MSPQDRRLVFLLMAFGLIYELTLPTPLKEVVAEDLPLSLAGEP